MLTNRMTTVIALALTAYVFAISVRANLGHTQSGWLLLPVWPLHGPTLIILNWALYAYLCWLGYWFIRGTNGRERIFVSGWFASLLLLPLRHFVPSCAWGVQFIRSFSLLMALGASASLLLRPGPPKESNGRTA